MRAGMGSTLRMIHVTRRYQFMLVQKCPAAHTKIRPMEARSSRSGHGSSPRIAAAMTDRNMPAAINAQKAVPK